MILRARVIIPVDRPPVDNGAVFIFGDRIADVGRWADLRKQASGEVCDLGEVILMPGLVNGHCHLEYTHLAGRVSPDGGFTAWLRNIIRAKGWADQLAPASIWQSGLEQAVASGTTTLCDIVSNAAILPNVRTDDRVRLIGFLEMTGVISGRPDFEILENALEKIAGLGDPTVGRGLSPHALYSTSAGLRRKVAVDGRSAPLPKTIHLAESRDEWEMFVERRGPMHEWLEPLRDLSECSGRTPVETLDATGPLGPGCSVAHANYVSESDVELLARRNVSVVHCPKSHAFFGHDPFPHQRLKEAGVNVCLGTDSLASTRLDDGQLPTLNMFHEMASFADAHPDVSPSEVLAMSTSNGSLLPGVDRNVGKIAPGASADLIAIPYTGSIADCEESAIRHRNPVAASMVRGRWVIGPNSTEVAR